MAFLPSLRSLRADAAISVEEHIDVYGVIGKDIGFKDPRHSEKGHLSYSQPDGIEEKDFEDWDRLRISLTIPDGSRDMVSGKSTMDEVRMDTLNGISYEKGCYVGQELTARMHYRGLGKKHLYTVTADNLKLDKLPLPQTQIERDGKIIGEMRSSCMDIGIALLNDKIASEIL